MKGKLLTEDKAIHKRWSYTITNQQEAHQLVVQAKRCATQIRPKAVGGGIFGHFSNFDKCRLEVAGDVISDKPMGPDVLNNHVKFGDHHNNRSREIAPEAV